MDEYNWGQRLGTIELSPEEKALRRRFVKEYLKDYDHVAACLRLGFEAGFASSYGEKFLLESYTNQILNEYERKQRSDEELAEERIDLTNLSIAALRNAAVNGTWSARVRAAQTLLDLYDVKAAVKVDSGVSSGVMVVPAIADVSAWEKTASTSQEELMAQAAMD